MSLTATRSLANRFVFTARAEPVHIDAAPPVSGYAWRPVAATASLILVHGLQSHAGWFSEAGEALLDRGIAVYALDRRGSGSSTGAVRGDVDRYTDWFDEVAAMVRLAREEYPDAPVHLVGHCFGANVALGAILIRRVADVRSLIMLTPGFYVLPDYSLAEKIGIAVSAFVAPTRRFRVPQDDGLFSRDPEVVDWIRADQLGAKSLTARCLFQINKMLGFVRGGAGQLKVPLLVCEAERDRLSDNVRNRALLATALGERCRWATFGAEHFLLAEPCRDDVLDTIVAWVTQQEA